MSVPRYQTYDEIMLLWSRLMHSLEQAKVVHGQPNGEEVRRLWRDVRVFEMSSDVVDMLEETESPLYTPRLPYRAIFLPHRIQMSGKQFSWGYGALLVGDAECKVRWEIIIAQKTSGELTVVYRSLIPGDWTYSKHAVPLKVAALLETLSVEVVNVGRIKTVGGPKGTTHPSYQTYSIDLVLPLRKYVQALRVARAFGFARSSHWVRGHWRTLHDPSYYREPGTRVWVMPHIRGARGLPIIKPYTVARRIA